MFPFGNMENLYEEEKSMKNIVHPFKLTNLAKVFMKSDKNYCQVLTWPQMG